MSFAWVLNLDAELELARGKPGYVAQQKLLAQLAEHGGRSRALLGPGDVLLSPDRALPANPRRLVFFKPQPPSLVLGEEARASSPRKAKLFEPPLLPAAPPIWMAGVSHQPPTDLAALRGRAWCPTPLALAAFTAHGIRPEPHPPAHVLRRVNHRLFSHQLGGGLPGQRYVTSRAELRSVLDHHQRHWLLKRPLTFAGRGQLRAIGPLTDKQWTWVEASLEKDGLIIEPLVEPLLEFSLHGFVWRSGAHELGRPCTQDVSERGTFRDVRLTEPGELLATELSALRERAGGVARALTEAGYFGPFGVDAYRYRDGGHEGFCALGEINARYTLGFATGFPRHPSELSLE